MQKDFAMFTDAGNAAVGGIVDLAPYKFEDPNEAWDWVLVELTALGTTITYSEATDTAVRERVYAALKGETG